MLSVPSAEKHFVCCLTQFFKLVFFRTSRIEDSFRYAYKNTINYFNRKSPESMKKGLILFKEGFVSQITS
jgi:hypothetical protein